MDDRAMAVRAVLRSLGQSEDIATLNDRKRIQKIIYFAQEVGVPLGYYFNWYLRGPYASSLARDYYNMPKVDHDVKLRADVESRLNVIAALLNDQRRPAGMSDADWLEILSSVHYLDKVSKLGHEQANEKLKREKPALYPFVDSARLAIGDHLGAHGTQAHQ